MSIAKRALTVGWLVVGRDRLGVLLIRRRFAGRVSRVLALGRRGPGAAEAAHALEDLGEVSARPDCTKAGERARGGPAAVVAMRAGANVRGSRESVRESTRKRRSSMVAFEERAAT